MGIGGSGLEWVKLAASFSEELQTKSSAVKNQKCFFVFSALNVLSASASRKGLPSNRNRSFTPRVICYSYHQKYAYAIVSP